MRAIITLTIFLASSVFCVAQGILVTSGSEKTVAGNQVCTSVMFQSKGRWAFGGFYQTSLARVDDNIITKDPFYGITMLAPVAKAERITFYLQGRLGIVHDNFVVAVPGLVTQLNISKRFGMSFGTSLRMGYPALSGQLVVKLF